MLLSVCDLPLAMLSHELQQCHLLGQVRKSNRDNDDTRQSTAMLVIFRETSECIQSLIPGLIPGLIAQCRSSRSRSDYCGFASLL